MVTEATERYRQRLSALFAELDRLAASPMDSTPAVHNELEALRARLLKLETEIRESEKAEPAQQELAAAEPKGEPGRARPALIYESDRVGFAYKEGKVEPVRDPGSLRSGVDGDIQAALTAGDQAIGELRVQQEPGRPLTPEDMNLTNAVAQQASLQIQNLRLLAATERARVEAEASTRRFIHEGWESYLDAIHQSERIGYAYDEADVQPYTEGLPANSGFHEPLHVMEEQVGQIYIKTEPSHPLSGDDREVVAAVARQIAQQVENIRLLADASRARAEAEEATRRLSRESWDAYVTGADETAFGFLYDSNRVVPLDEAPVAQQVNIVQPLTVRGEAVGQLALAGWSDVPAEASDLIAAVATQASTHIETLRLSQQNEKRAHEMEAVTELSTTTSKVLDPDSLLQTIVDLTKQRFGVYHASIYLANDSWKTLMLAAGAGEVGRQMVAEQHSVPFDSEQSLVARSARERRAIIAKDVQNEPGFVVNPSLPHTRAEMAVPMIVGDQLLGVFSVQSERASGFTQGDAGIYTTLASQVGVALQNARLYVEQAATVAQLRELDRLKSSFLANMSHELRTPLNSILGFADVMLAELDGPLTENMGTDLQLVQKNGQHLLHLINDVLDMAKIEAGRMNLSPEQFVVKDVLEEVLSITSTLADEKKLDVRVDADSDADVSLLADRTRVQQVMINLVNNAIKFTDNQGKIRIHARRQGEGAALITVKDTGMGIPPDKLDTIFQEFAQIDTSTTRKTGGTGLGLPISRRLVEMHGGRLWAESKGIPGEGSTFFVELPLEAQIAELVEKRVK